MTDLTVSYKGNAILTANASLNRKLDTSGRYCEDDITIQYTRPTFSTQTKSVTPTESAQTVTPDSGYDGLSQVNVARIPTNYIVPSGTKSITENGTGIDVANYAAVDVNVSGGGGSSVTTVSFSSESALYVNSGKGIISYVDGNEQVQTTTQLANYSQATYQMLSHSLVVAAAGAGGSLTSDMTGIVGLSLISTGTFTATAPRGSATIQYNLYQVD